MTNGGRLVTTWGEREGVHIDVYDLGSNKYRLDAVNPTLFKVKFALDFDPRGPVTTSKSLPIQIELDSQRNQQQKTDHKLSLGVTLKGRVQPKLTGVCYSSLPGSSGELLSKPYAVPWKGRQYECIQGFSTQYTHTGPLKYGADFSMGVGTSIYAARAGTVADMRDEAKGPKIFGVGTQYAGSGVMGNYVIIKHESNIYTAYQHLKADSLTVKAGDDVTEGQKIGESGNTGKSNEPHLHFDVRSLLNCRWETNEFWFRGSQDKSLNIVQGNKY